ncbi:tetratricopeptide repeat protein [Thermodesulfovibrio sp. 3907-1M]|uniref:Tetratricopeptide repeat protein n=1 Tax=Thermodesulfovibrio autotrophicus TaxID=3118333 RepID=A0AAU8GXU9_9BACT
MIYYKTMKIILSLLIFLLVVACTSEERVRQTNESDFHTEIGYAYYIEKNYQLAFVEFHKALQIDPDNKNALHGLALVHMEFQEYETARDLFLKILSIAPDYADAWFNLGICYQRLNMHKEAIEAFQKALNNPLFITQDKAFLGQGLSYYRTGQYKEARDAFDKAIKRNFLLIPAHFYMALTYQKLNQYSEAVKTLRNAIRLDSSFKGDVDKFAKTLEEQLKTGHSTMSKEDILDLLEILKY